MNIKNFIQINEIMNKIFAITNKDSPREISNSDISLFIHKKDIKILRNFVQNVKNL